MKLNYMIIIALIALSLPLYGQHKKKTTHKPSAQSQEKTDTTASTPEFIELDEMPTPINHPMPEYPEAARKAGIEGTVWVNILVGTDGMAKEVKVIKMNGGSPEIKQSALDAAKKYTFKPGMKNKKAEKVWVAVPFRFKLK